MSTADLAHRLARAYVESGGRVFGDPDVLLRPETPAGAFIEQDRDHPYSQFLDQLVDSYRWHLESSVKPISSKAEGFADLPYVGADVLAGKKPVVVMAQSTLSKEPGSVTFWAMLFLSGRSIVVFHEH